MAYTVRMDQSHIDRVQQELKAVGVSSYGSIKFAAQYLPKIIHPDEHIKGAIYGRYQEGRGLLGFVSGMLIATDHRIIFLDHKPGFTSMDELTYEAIIGVKRVSNGISTTVTLHARLGDYILRFANPKGVDQFIEYVEARRLDTVEPMGTDAKMPQSQAESPATMPEMRQPHYEPDQATIDFLTQHDIGVLSTLGRTGEVHGAAVYYNIDTENRLYVVTKASTQKARDMFSHGQVAFTVFDPTTAQTAQVTGDIEVVSDPAESQYVIKMFMQPRKYGDKVMPPPIATIHEDAFVAIRIIPTNIKFTDYKQKQNEE